jgi:Na+/pantothenate symporter
MISKTMLKIDLIGQILIIGGLLLITAFEPKAFLFFCLLTAFCLGFWQFFNGLIEAIYFQNKTRQKYLFAAIAYIIGFAVFTVSNDYFMVEISNQFMEILILFYFIGGSLGFAGWYFYQTYKELGNRAYQHPRSFWDYEF